MDARTTTMDNIADPLKTEISRHLNIRSLINLSLASHFTYRLFKPTLFQQLQKYVERSAKKQVEILIKIYPELSSFICRNKVITYGGVQYENPTLLQLSRSLCDIEMCKILLGGKKEEFIQIKTFPGILIDKENNYDFTKLIEAIESGHQVEDALIIFRKDLDIIIREKGFPFQALIDACGIYDKKIGIWIQTDTCKLFAIKVIGYLQRLAPAWFRRALACGLSNCGESNFILLSKESIDPALDVVGKGLGYEFCVNVYGAADNTPLGQWSELVLIHGIALIIKEFFEQRQHLLTILCSENSPAYRKPSY